MHLYHNSNFCKSLQPTRDPPGPKEYWWLTYTSGLRVSKPSNISRLSTNCCPRFSSSLAYLGAVDTEYLLDQSATLTLPQAHILTDCRFDRRLSQATLELPLCVSGTLYSTWSMPATSFCNLLTVYFKVLFNIVFRSANILSGVPGGIYALPIAYFAFYLTYRSHINASRGLQKLTTEARGSLKKQLRETIDGIRHLRAFGWTDKNSQRTSELLELSQRCRHSNSCLENWLRLIFELCSCIIITVLVFLSTGQSTGIGISFWSLQCIPYALNYLAFHLAPLDIALFDFFELQRMIESVPRENNIAGLEIPASWPDQGQIVFQNVTARYR